MEDYPIDFVITWVDGSDTNWLSEKAKYSGKTERDPVIDDRDIRYEDLGTLKYWFRAVEKNAPWVRKIHFVTYGHIPEWLDINNPKINIVRHSDYIPKEYLPTFSSHTIELNFHRIKGLAEHFVYFNDDTFLGAPVRKEDFFKKGLPRDIAAINALWYVYGNTPAYVQIQDTAVINKHFAKNKTIIKNFTKWFNLSYGTLNLRTLALLPWPHFITLYTRHLPTSFLKSTYIEVWESEPELLDSTCQHRIRSYFDINQWLFEFWQICKGDFYPAKRRDGKGFVLGNPQNTKKLCKAIENERYKLLCVGEGDWEYDTQSVNKEICNSFEKVLPIKSGFEK